MSRGLLGLLVKIFRKSYWTGERLDKYGEELTERKLNLLNLFGKKGKTLKNIYLPKDNGETSEIDLIYITRKGIFVLESKNFSGWIFGDEKSQYWTASLANGQKNRFYNPLKQNRTHIKWLSSYMASYSTVEIPMYSIIVFSDRCELKKVPFDSPEAIICKRGSLYWTIKKMWEILPDILSDVDVEVTYNTLSKLTDVSELQKQTHIDNINNNINKSNTQPFNYVAPVNRQNAAPQYTPYTNYQNPVSSQAPRCQRCGSPLVIRTVKEGYNTGKQFYGCSRYPQCKYTQNL